MLENIGEMMSEVSSEIGKETTEGLENVLNTPELSGDHAVDEGLVEALNKKEIPESETEYAEGLAGILKDDTAEAVSFGSSTPKEKRLGTELNNAIADGNKIAAENRAKDLAAEKVNNLYGSGSTPKEKGMRTELTNAIADGNKIKVENLTKDISKEKNA